MTYIRLEKDADGIVELIFDQQGKSVNVMGDEYAEAMPGLWTNWRRRKTTLPAFMCAVASPGSSLPVVISPR